MTFTATFQGGLVKVKTPFTGDIPEGRGGKRGKITVFSAASRKRLLELFATISLPKKQQRGANPPVFITLTYPAVFPDAPTSKKHLRAFLRRLSRMASKIQPDRVVSAIWRLEFQERGAPHFHIVAFNLPFIPKELIQKMWAQIIGYDRPFTRIEKIETMRKLLSYVAKYVAKASSAKYTALDGGDFVNEDGEIFPAEGESERSSAECGDADAASGSSGFNYLAYLSAVGRWWGYFNRYHIPFAEAFTVSIKGDTSIYYNFRRAARRIYKRLPMHRSPNTFSLFCASADRWYELLENMLITGCEYSGPKQSLSLNEKLLMRSLKF